MDIFVFLENGLKKKNIYFKIMLFSWDEVMYLKFGNVGKWRLFKLIF